MDSRGALFASTFDPANATLGAPIPLLDGVSVSPLPDIGCRCPGTGRRYTPGGGTGATTCRRSSADRSLPEPGYGVSTLYLTT